MFCVSFFYAHINMAFCFYIYAVIMLLLSCSRNNIGPNHENSVPCGSLSHFLVLDRLGALLIQGSAFFSAFNQKKMWVKIQRQMDKVIKVLNPINMAPKMTALTKMTKKQKFWIFILHCLMKSDGAETLVNEVQDMSQKIINEFSYKVCRRLPCLSCTEK